MIIPITPSSKPCHFEHRKEKKYHCGGESKLFALSSLKIIFEN